MFPSSRLRVEKITTLDELRAIYDDSDAHPVFHTENIFLTFLWLSTWWQVYGQPDQLHVLVVWDEDRLVGVLPLVLQKTSAGVRYLSFMGAGELTPDDLDLLSAPEKRREVLQALVDYLYAARSEWDVIELDKLPACSSTCEEFEALFRERGLVVDQMEAALCYSVALPESFEDYLSRLSKSFRHNLKRRKRNLQADYPDLEWIQAETPEQVQHAFDALVRLHQARWTKRGFPGSFASRDFYEFHRAVVQHALRAGLLRLYYLHTGENIIAVEYLFRSGDVVQDYLGGFDETLAQYSLGNLMVAYSIQMSINSKARVFDLLEGDEAYKEDWVTEVRKNVCLRIYGTGWHSKFERMRYKTVNLARKCILRYVPKNIRRPIWRATLRLRAFLHKYEPAIQNRGRNVFYWAHHK